MIDTWPIFMSIDREFCGTILTIIGMELFLIKVVAICLQDVRMSAFGLVKFIPCHQFIDFA